VEAAGKKELVLKQGQETIVYYRPLIVFAGISNARKNARAIFSGWLYRYKLFVLLPADIAAFQQHCGQGIVSTQILLSVRRLMTGEVLYTGPNCCNRVSGESFGFIVCSTRADISLDTGNAIS